MVKRPRVGQEGYDTEYWTSDSDSDSDYESEFDSESEPLYKRQKLSLPRTQVCIVSHDGYDGYDIVVADLDSLRNYEAAAAACNDVDDEFIMTPIRPALRLQLPKKIPASFFTFCGLGSKLYVFEAKSAYAIDLSPYYSNSNDLTHATVVLKKRMLRKNKIRAMHHPKKQPFAIPTPDAKKILIFSRDIDISNVPSPRKPEGVKDFELYDPKTDTWQQLPGIRQNEWCTDWRTHDLRIAAFAFIGASTFFIKSTSNSMFTLNLESIDQGWQKMDTFYGSAYPHPDSKDRFLVIDQLLYVNPFTAYDIHIPVGDPFGFTIPVTSVGDASGWYRAPLVHQLLGEDADDDGKYNFCTLLSGTRKRTRSTYMSLNITSCDLARYKRNRNGSDQDYEELDRCMTIDDSIEFFLDGEQVPSFRPLSFFSIRP